jgi:hypothetical protein
MPVSGFYFYSQLSDYLTAIDLGSRSMTISTRRLLARPSVESLLAIGLASPRPRDWICLAGYAGVRTIAPWVE